MNRMFAGLIGDLRTQKLVRGFIRLFRRGDLRRARDAYLNVPYTRGGNLVTDGEVLNSMIEQDQLWTEAYLKLKEQWKLEPNWKLIEYLHLIPQGPVLDLGAGNGRNALFFAKLGCEVDYVDISKTYSKRMKTRAKDENLELTAHNMDIRDFDIPEKHYVLIIASKILQLFPKADIEDIARKMNAGLARKGLIYVYTFSVETLKHSKRLHELELVEENTYYHRKYRQHFHYFKSDELLSLFPKLKMIFYNEEKVHDLKKRDSRYLFILEYLGQRVH